MAGENELIEISLLSGQSDRPVLTFTPGTPANPVSVGTAAQWVVVGEGVAPIHLYLVFDGRSVHVAAAAANAQVLLAGAQVGASWARAPVPCELRFGGACVIMRYAARAAYPEEERTVHDGGALWQAAQQAVKDAIERAKQGPPDDSPHLGPQAQLPPPRPAAGAPASFGATVPMGEQQQQAFRDAVAKATSSLPPPLGEDSPATVRAPLVGGPLGPPSPPLEVTMIAPQPLMPRPAASSGSSAPPPARGQPFPPATLQAAAPTGSAAPPANTSPGRDRTPEKKLAFWHEASGVKKATLILMPFALVMSYFMLQPDPPPPPPKVIAGAGASKRAAQARDGGVIATGTAPASGSDGGGDRAEAGGDAAATSEVSDQTTAAVVSPMPDSRPEPPPKVAPLPRGMRTPERQALDAVAAGSFDDASRLYTALSAVHPDDPSYKEAARILREKTGQPRGNAQ
jgi:hypothetical protein